MGYFYSAPESVLGMVPALGERRRLDALIAQFEVLPKLEVLRTLGGQKRKHRARERKTGDVFANCQPPGLYKDHHSPTPLQGFPSQKLQPPPSQCPDLPHFCPKPRNPISGCVAAVRSEEGCTRSRHVTTGAPTQPPS